MDFNIVTFHRSYNYGAVLQAYALQEFIGNLGYSVGVYDYEPKLVNVGGDIKGRVLKLIQKANQKEKIRRKEDV